ncbi:hypothetical protein L7F22_016978 [Adiantum nelumboides]|nr:hypothetical protein [Adiantum nelumboides]
MRVDKLIVIDSSEASDEEVKERLATLENKLKEPVLDNLVKVCTANTFESATASTSDGELEDATTGNEVVGADGTINGKPTVENARPAAESDNAAAESNDDVSSSVARRTRSEATDKQWDLQFLDSLADEEVLFEVMMVAHYLNILRLEHLTCVRLGERMRGMTPEHARAIFNLASDFTPEEETAIRRQNEWAFSRT